MVVNIFYRPRTCVLLTACCSAAESVNFSGQVQGLCSSSTSSSTSHSERWVGGEGGKLPDCFALSIYIFINHSYLILILQSTDAADKDVINTFTKSHVTINLHYLLLQQKWVNRFYMQVQRCNFEDVSIKQWRLPIRQGVKTCIVASICIVSLYLCVYSAFWIWA